MEINIDCNINRELYAMTIYEIQIVHKHGRNNARYK